VHFIVVWGSVMHNLAIALQSYIQALLGHESSKVPDLIQHVPQPQLASFLGIKPQSQSRSRTRILEKVKRNFIP
jgi:hypothetical protein